MICYSRIVRLLKSRHYVVTNNFSSKAGRVMGKLMGVQNKKKFYSSKDPILPVSGFSGKVPLENKITGNPKRTSILNKLFMRNITDLMATGEYANQLYGYGIEVNKVKITPDYRFLKVYWIAKESSNNDVIENLLKKNAGSLKHELSQLRVMGQVPNIVFVKDKGYFNVLDVELKLAVADFGEDYVKSDLADELKSEHELWTMLDKDIKKKVEAFDSSIEDSSDELNSLPLMPQNVLGLNHADILNRIKRSKNKSDAPHRKAEKDVINENESVDVNSKEYVSQEDQRQAFRQFLHSRQILRQKQRKIVKNWSPDNEYLQEESRESYLNSMEYVYEEPIEEEDYVEEIDEEQDKC